MEHMSMLSSIEDSKEREIFFDIEKKTYCKMEFWCQTKQRVEDFHTSDVWECPRSRPGAQNSILQ